MKSLEYFNLLCAPRTGADAHTWIITAFLGKKKYVCFLSPDRLTDQLWFFYCVTQGFFIENHTEEN